MALPNSPGLLPGQRPPDILGELPHDGGMGLDGTIYFTVNNPNRSVTVGKLDPKTGALKFLKAGMVKFDKKSTGKKGAKK